MTDSSDPSTEIFMPPTMIPAGYGYESEFMQNWLPGITGMGSPGFQGQVDPGLSPTQQAAIHSAQQYATSGPQMSQDIMGFLGNMMGGGGAFSPTYRPNLSDSTLQQFMQPPGGPPGGQGGPWGPRPMNLGLAGQGGTGPGGGIFSPPGGADPFGRMPYGADNLQRPMGTPQRQPSPASNPMPPGWGGGYGAPPGQQYQTPGGGTGYAPYPQPPGSGGMPPGYGGERDPYRQQIPVGPGGYQSLPGYQPSWYGGDGVPGRQGSESRTDPYRQGDGGGSQGGGEPPMPDGPDSTGGTGGLGFTPGANNSLALHGSYRPLVDAALGSGALSGMQRGGAKEDWRLTALMDYGSLGGQLDPLMNQWGQATDPEQKAQLEQQARGMIEGAWNQLPEQARSQQSAAAQGRAPEQWMQQYLGGGASGGGAGVAGKTGAAATAASPRNASGQALQTQSATQRTGWNPATRKWEEVVKAQPAARVRGQQQGGAVRGDGQTSHTGDPSGQADAGRPGDPLMKNWYYNMPFPYEGLGGLLMPRIPTSQFGGYGIPAYQPIQGNRGFLGWDPSKGILPIQGANVGGFHNPSNKFQGWPTQSNPTPHPSGPGGPWTGGMGDDYHPDRPSPIGPGDFPGPGGGGSPPGDFPDPEQPDPQMPDGPDSRTDGQQFAQYGGGYDPYYGGGGGYPQVSGYGTPW